MKNGRPLALAGADGFDALITTDGGIEHQQNPATLPVGVVIPDARSNDIDDLRPLVPGLLVMLRSLPPRTFAHVPARRPQAGRLALVVFEIPAGGHRGLARVK